MKEKLERMSAEKYGKPLSECSDAQAYRLLLGLTKDLEEGRPAPAGKRKLYYISAEFLVGKLLSNNLINLGIYDEVKAALKSAGKDLALVEEAEPEPALGNGGLGRLAACFLDSIATLGLPGDGVGLCYHYGLFRQVFQNCKQGEIPDQWMEPESWLTPTDVSFQVPFGGFTLKSVMYDIAVAGYGRETAGKLHLFDVSLPDESLVEHGIHFDKNDIRHNLTLFLYPDDSDYAGQILRVYQQYFMVSNAAQLILKEADERGADLRNLNQYAVVQINDTHPSMIIPELIRLLTARGIPMDDAISIVSKTCAYTNHTVLSEALEKWPMDYLKRVAPHLVPIIRELDKRVKRKYSDEKLAIIDEDNRVHMAHMDIHYGFSVNGVAALHTEILKNTELKAFSSVYPGKFNNKTNGITFRRWLIQCNPALCARVTELIGDGWKKDAEELEKLLKFRKDPQVLQSFLDIKAGCKKGLKEYLKGNCGIDVDENSIFDIQIKRLHEYKRQQMNALYAVYKYKQIKAGHLPKRPITMLFGAKAAPAYVIAKDIIHLILCLQTLIEGDPAVSPWLKVAMVEDYNVTKAEKLIPACDISEQISLASKEASGTGNMKFMLNGAVTLGTMDGANVEIHDLVGEDNIYIFGKSSAEILELYAGKTYSSRALYDGDPLIEELVDFIISKELIRIGDPENLCRLYKDIVGKDWFMALLDLRSYIETKERAFSDYEDRFAWAEKMLVNTAKAGFFSADRTIRQYNEDIWRLS